MSRISTDDRLKKKFAALLCSNGISNPDMNEKSSLEKEHPFLIEFVLLLHSCFVPYNALLEKYFIVNQ